MKYIVLFLLFPFLAYNQNQKPASPSGRGASPIPAQNSKLNTQNSTYAVVIGISDYQDKDIPDLRFADKDAEAFANFLRSPAGGALDGDHLQVLTNTQATAGRIAEALDALIEKAKKDDQVIIYFSGHGDVEGKKLTQPGFLLCWDSPSRVYMGGGTYSLSFLQEVVSTLSVQNQAKVIVITDACHAGKLAGSQIGGAQLTTANLAKQYANEVKILSCQPNEFSLEGPQWGGGRGVFSYHLVDGLFGLADRNNDGQITLGELDRYLEDNVTGEAAPQSQVPILLGNKTDRIATVNANILAELKKNKTGNMQVFAATESRGFEEQILAKVDTSIREVYKAFKLAVHDKRFLSPESDCAEKYYGQLTQVEALAQLRGIMTRNYAAALQDDAQQMMNSMLKTGLTPHVLAAKKEWLITNKYPAYLERASQLLGREHYMYATLQARKEYFLGVAGNSREETKSHYLKAIQLQPDLPHAYVKMIYCCTAEEVDSAEQLAKKAMEIAPKWVVPYIELASFYTYIRQPKKVEELLNKALLVDSNSILIWYRMGDFYLGLGDIGKAEFWLKKTVDGIGEGVCFSCAHNDLAIIYSNTGRFNEAELQLKKSVDLDPQFSNGYLNLGNVYIMTDRIVEAEVQYRKCLNIDSTEVKAYNNLGYLYLHARRYAEGEIMYKKAISLDSANAEMWSNLGELYLHARRYPEAESILKKAIALDSTFSDARNYFGKVFFKTNRPDDARQNFLKALELNPNNSAAMLGMAYLLFSEGKTEEAIGYVEQAIGKGITLEQLQSDEDLAPLRDMPEWKVLMKKHFPEKFKD